MKTPVRPLRFAVLLLALCAGLAGAQPSRGGPPGRGEGGMGPGQAGGFEGPRERRLQWVGDQRDQRGGPPAERPRMSPEERRQLRQEIHDAGRELYPPRRGPRGDRPPRNNE